MTSKDRVNQQDQPARVHKEDLEREWLSPFATLSVGSRGRLRHDEPCAVRTAYERDTGRILYSMPFRRLRHKTQVFFDAQNDHVCTRMEHVLYVSYLAETIGGALGLNRDLIRAIALGHDLGHTPYGHAGEMTLDNLVRGIDKTLVFCHERHGLRVVDLLSEHKGHHGLNLTFEVRDGIASHCGEKHDEFVLVPMRDKKEEDLERSSLRHEAPATLEGCVVRFADRIAYVGRDIEDATRSGLLCFDELPLELRATLGRNNSEIVDTLVKDLIDQSRDQDAVIISEPIGRALQRLIEINVERIYQAPRVKRYGIQVRNVLEGLFEYFFELAQAEPPCDMNSSARDFYEYKNRHPEQDAPPVRIVTDYIAGMTDPYASRIFKTIYEL